MSAEVIVVDNGSKDGSADMVAEQLRDVRIIRNSENLGFAAANNQAIQVAKGKFVLLLNSDTIVLGNVLSASLDYMKSNKDVGVMGCRVLNTDRTVQLTCSQLPSLTNLVLLTTGLFRLSRPSFCGRYQLRNWQRDSERDVQTVTGCFMLVRKIALDQVGLLDESFFFYGEETDWCKRFAQHGWKLRFAPVGEIIHHGSLSSRACNHRRDLMLSEGILRFHRKHSGVFATAIAWCLLGIFNASRFVYWQAIAWFSTAEHATQRAEHFRYVVKDFVKAWPRKEVRFGR